MRRRIMSEQETKVAVSESAAVKEADYLRRSFARVYGLTSDECRVIDLLADAFIEFKKLPTIHDSDVPEFIHSIHALQNIVMSRLANRVHPEFFRTSQIEKV